MDGLSGISAVFLVMILVAGPAITSDAKVFFTSELELLSTLSLTGVHKITVLVSRQTEPLIEKFSVAALAVSLSFAGFQVFFPPFSRAVLVVFFYEHAGLVAFVELSNITFLHLFDGGCW